MSSHLLHLGKHNSNRRNLELCFKAEQEKLCISLSEVAGRAYLCSCRYIQGFTDDINYMGSFDLVCSPLF